MNLNRKVKTSAGVTHEGGKANKDTYAQQLSRSVMTCMLWENNAYEDGESVAERIASLIPKVSPETVVQMILEAKFNMKLRQVPLFMARELARHPKAKSLSTDRLAEVISKIITRPDQIGEFLAMYWKEDKAADSRARSPLSRQVKKGLAHAFTKFDEYSLAKYNRSSAQVRLSDAMRMVHPTPKDLAQEELWGRLLSGNLVAPNTWEVRLSSGEDKKAVFEDLLSTGQLGQLALLRNLSGMMQAKVSPSLIYAALEKGGFGKDMILPSQYLAAYKAAPQFKSELEQAMYKSLDRAGLGFASGTTHLVVDNSASMYHAKISNKSTLTRADAAAALAILLVGASKNVTRVYSFSHQIAEVPAFRGFGLAQQIQEAVEVSGTRLGAALSHLLVHAGVQPGDRIIVLTDEQSADSIPSLPKGIKGYIVNVAANQKGVHRKNWLHIDGFTDAVVNYIREHESYEYRSAKFETTTRKSEVFEL